MFTFQSSKISILAGTLCALSISAPARADDVPQMSPMPQDKAAQSSPPVENAKPQVAAPPMVTPQAAVPEKGKAYNAKQRQIRFENAVRGLMTQTGFPDAAVQDAVIAHMQSEARARNPLRRSGEKLFVALQSPDVSDEKMNALLKKFQDALEADDKRREAAEVALDAKIGYAKNPRLQSMLVLFGIIGDGALFVPLREPPQRGGSYAPGEKAPLQNPLQAPNDVPRALENRSEYPAGGPLGQ